MVEVKLTKEQQKVVDTKDCNLLVAAAAGSGKTAVLVKRIIKKVMEDSQDIDRLLIVTFTNAAAGEMRERIGMAIEEASFFNKSNCKNTSSSFIGFNIRYVLPFFLSNPQTEA